MAKQRLKLKAKVLYAGIPSATVLATRLDVSPAYVSQIFRRVTEPSPRIIRDLAKILRCSQREIKALL